MGCSQQLLCRVSAWFGIAGLPSDQAAFISPERSFYKNFTKSKKKAFTKYAKKYTDGKKQIESELEQLKKHSVVIRVLAHTQVGTAGKQQRSLQRWQWGLRACTQQLKQNALQHQPWPHRRTRRSTQVQASQQARVCCRWKACGQACKAAFVFMHVAGPQAGLRPEEGSADGDPDQRWQHRPEG